MKSIYMDGATHNDQHKELNIEGNVTEETLRRLMSTFMAEGAETVPVEEENAREREAEEEDIETENVETTQGVAETPKAKERLTTFSKEVLRGYIDAGLLGEDLKPVKGLSNGQASIIAHDIAERLGMTPQFWQLFEDLWEIKCLRTYYSKAMSTKKNGALIKRLQHLK